MTLHARVGDCSRSEVALRKIRRRKSLPQPAQARFMAARGFLKLEAEALRNGDDVIEETFVPSSWIGVGRHGRRTVASRVLGPFLPAVRGEEAGRGCLSDLLGCPLEFEIPGGTGGPGYERRSEWCSARCRSLPHRWRRHRADRPLRACCGGECWLWAWHPANTSRHWVFLWG